MFRKPSDLDVWTDDEAYMQQEKVKQGVDMKLIPKRILNLLETPDGLHCTPNDVYTIKCSHLGWKTPAGINIKPTYYFLSLKDVL